VERFKEENMDADLKEIVEKTKIIRKQCGNQHTDCVPAIELAALLANVTYDEMYDMTRLD